MTQRQQFRFFTRVNYWRINTSSEVWLTRQTAEKLKESQIDMIDAPASGAEPGAKTAELIFMVGGEVNSVPRARPLLDIMGKLVFHLGPIGAGHIMKSMNNLVTAMTFMATTEALTVGKQLGLDPNVMTDVLKFNAEVSRDKVINIFRTMGFIEDNTEDSAAIEMGCNKLTELLDKVGLLIRLQDIGFQESHIENIAKETLKTAQLRTNPRQPTEKDIETILREIS